METVVLWSSWSVEGIEMPETVAGASCKGHVGVPGSEFRLYPEPYWVLIVRQEGTGARLEAKSPIRAGSKNPTESQGKPG